MSGHLPETLKEAYFNDEGIKKKLTDDAWANVEAQVKSMREEIRTTHEKKQAEAKAMYEKESKRITDMFNANKERWIQMIVDYTVGRREQE